MYYSVYVLILYCEQSYLQYFPVDGAPANVYTGEFNKKYYETRVFAKYRRFFFFFLADGILRQASLDKSSFDSFLV